MDFSACHRINRAIAQCDVCVDYGIPELDYICVQ